VLRHRRLPQEWRRKFRPHTAAYVSIRQHTVSIRQHNLRQEWRRRFRRCSHARWQG
jgi:hypothetical protein